MSRHAQTTAFTLTKPVDIMDVGYTCAYLATPFAKCVTGELVYVDGGANLIA
jgi:enoyl-[acyl-carrier-protein] reductase (NADH)